MQVVRYEIKITKIVSVSFFPSASVMSNSKIKLDDGYASLNKRMIDEVSDVSSLFGNLHMDSSMVKGRDVTYYPANLASHGPFEFKLPPDSECYLDPSSLRLYGRFKVTKENGRDLVSDVPAVAADADAGVVAAAAVAGDHVSIVNFFPHSLWSHIEVMSNDVMVTNNASLTYMYKAYIESILTYGSDAQETHMQSSIMEMDDAGEFDTLPTNAINAPCDNSGYTKRALLIAKSQEVEFETGLHVDMFNVGKFFPPLLKLGIIFNRNPDKFSLLYEDVSQNYRIEIKALKLTARKIRMNEKIYAADQMRLLKEPMLIPYTSSIIKTTTVSSGNSTFHWQSVFHGLLPQQIVLAMVDQNAKSGRGNLNPWNFKHNKVLEVIMSCDGERIPPGGYKLNIPQNRFMECYRALFDNCGIQRANTGNMITPALFKGGCTIFTFDLTPDRCLSNHPHTPWEGSIDIQFEFQEGLKSGIEILAFGTKDDFMSIDSNNQIKTLTYERKGIN